MLILQSNCVNGGLTLIQVHITESNKNTNRIYNQLYVNKRVLNLQSNCSYVFSYFRTISQQELTITNFIRIHICNVEITVKYLRC